MKDFSIKKLYYSISEVSKITEVEQYVLRFWETVFEQLKPQKNRAGNRIFTHKDIELILLIKSLLKEKKYTIEGAKQTLRESLVPKDFEKDEVQEERNSKENDSHPLAEPITEPLNQPVFFKIPREEIVELRSFLELLLTKVL